MANSIVNDPYDFLGVKKTINAAGILTRIGGSRPSVEVFKAMEEFQFLEADDIARGVTYAITQPDNVNVNEITIRPAMQQF